jgi:UDP-N-acetylmuramyl pentapeptide phosphotransferase/UDP-N-acetylglucosamine-1-phosphate transferase
VTSVQAVLVATSACVVSVIVVALLVPVLRRRGVLDVPNRRSSHEVPIPRGGGLGLLVGLAAGLGVAAASGLPSPGWPIILGIALLACLGLYEDLAGDLPVAWRLGIQAAAAALVIAAAEPLRRLPLPAPIDVELGILGWPLSFLWVLGVVNIFNFLDGIDGYAGVQGLVAGLGLSLVGWGSWIGPAGLAAAGACTGFLVLNWAPARIFMGDVGSLALGFLFAVMPFGEGRGAAPLLVFVAVLCLWFFLSDGAFTMARRLLKGERIWQPHRSHLYQRLTIAGWSHARVVVTVSIGMIVVAALGVGAGLCGRPGALWIAVSLACIAFVVYWRGVIMAERGAVGPSTATDRGMHD